ncbi:MAG: MFS transporter [Candidatus Zixiibacteriota bacterium]
MIGSPADSLWRRDVVGWSLYDFANTIYSMNIVSLYLKRYLVEDLGYGDYYFDIPFALSMLLAAILLPALGVLSDHATKKKTFLFLFTITCCISVGLMPLIPAGALLGMLVLFMVANFSYEAAMPFYNALLYSVADGRQARLVSGVGVAWGYVGSIVGMAFVLPFVTGDFFGHEISFLDGGGKLDAFLPSAVLFFAFAMPCFIWVREKPSHAVARSSLSDAYREVWQALRQTRKYPGVLRFLVADYFVEDAVATVILNIGLYLSIVLSMPEQQITTFLIISTITAVAGSFLVGFLAKHWSLHRMLPLVFSGWVIAFAAFVMTDHMPTVWVLGSLVGVLLGGLWTTTRPFLAEIVPRDELGKFFGLFSLSGRAAAVVGPLIWTLTVYLFSPERALGQWLGGILGLDSAGLARLPYKMGVLSLALMVLIGLLVFRGVPRTKESSHG